MAKRIPILFIALLILSGFAWASGGGEQEPSGGSSDGESGAAEEATGNDGQTDGDYATVVFAGGCFWCMEKPYDVLNGVIATTSGYAGGDVPDPTYQQVVSGRTGHTEVVQVTYDPDVVSLETLLWVFWRNIDPYDGTGQFCDRGSSYRPGIFYSGEEQRRVAEESREQVAENLDGDINTEVTELEAFYPAEDYHQNFYKTNSTRYETYRALCGRDSRLESIWGDEAGGENPPSDWL